MPRHGRLTLLLLLCLLAVAVPAQAEAACTISWATDQSGNWGEASNWSPARVPGLADDVCIDRGAANPTVTVATSDYSVHSLTSAERLTVASGRLALEDASSISAALDLNGGTFAANGTVTVSGTATLNATTLTGNGSITSTGTFLAPAATTLGLPLRNEGTLRISGGTLYLGQKLTNTGLIDLAGDSGITGGATLVQNGTVRKTAGTGISTVGSTTEGTCCFRIDGTAPVFEAHTGTLALATAADFASPTLTASAGATVRATAPPATSATLGFTGTLTGGGAGIVELTNLTVTNTSGTLPASLAGTLRVSGTTFNGFAAELVNAAELTVTGGSAFGNRFVNGPTGVLRQGADSTFSGNVANRGQWQLTGDVRLTQPGNGNLLNTGTFRKTAGNGTATIDGNLDATAPTLAADAGVLELVPNSSPWTGGATFITAAGATVRLKGVIVASGTFKGTGAGTVAWASGGISTGTSGATLDFPAGMLELRGGAANGTPLTNADALTIAGETTIGNGFVNAGTVTQRASIGFNGLVTNKALWAVEGDVALTQTANGRFQQDGTLRKASGGGTTTLDGRFDGTAPTFDVRAGTLLLREPSTWSAGARLDVQTGATFRFQRNDECCWALEASGTLTGAGGGRVELVNGRLYAPGATPLTLDFPAGYLHVSGGSLDHLTNAGELTLSGGRVADRFTNTGSIRQSADAVFSGTVVNSGLWEIQGDRTLAQSGNGSLSTTGTIRKSAGAGIATLNGAFNGTHPTFDVRAGTLTLGDVSTWTGGAQLDAAAGATFRFFREDQCCWAMTVSGRLTGSGAGRVVFDNGDLRGGATLDFPAGSFLARGGALRQLENAGTIELTGSHLGDRFTNSGTINQTGSSAGGYDGAIVNSGTWNLAGDSGLFSTANNSFVNSGAVRRSAGGSLVTIAGNFDNRGTVEARSGVLGVQESLQVQNLRALTGGTWLASGTGALTFPTMFGIETSAATIAITGADASIPELSALRRNTGTLTLDKGGALTIPSALVNAGTLALGRSARLSVNGFTQEPTGTLGVTLDGRPPGGAYGVLSASGAAALDGTLAVSTGSGFSAVADDRYEIVRAGSRTGAFAATTGLAISPSVAFAPALGENGVTLRVAPVGDKRSALRVTSVDATPAGALVPGDDVTVSYSVVNDGDATTAGTWTDSIYLSEDGSFDASDALIARAPHSGNVARGATYSGTLTAPLPGVVEGEYRFLVVPDSRGANPSLAPGAGARTSAPRSLEIPLLSAVDATVAAGRTRYYRVVAGPEAVQIDATFTVTGRARVLARSGSMPTPDAYDLGSDGEASPRLLVPGGQAIYVAVVGLSGGAFSLKAGAVAFALEEVTPARGSGSTTITVTGAGFSDAARVSLVGAAEAARVVVDDTRKLHATFDLSNVAPGAYAVRVTDGSRSATLPGAFTVAANPRAGRLVLSTMAPPQFRIGFGGFFSVTFRNTGESDVPMPLVRVTSDKATAWAVTRTGASGLPSTSFFVAREPGVVPPGGNVTVPIQFADSGVAPHEIVHFKTELVQPDDTPIDWSSRKAGLRPAGISSASWEKIWPAFLTIVGPTNRTYLAALRGAAQRGAVAGRDLQTEADLLLALRERAIARAPGAPIRGALTIAGKPGVAKIVNVFDASGRGGATRTDDEGAFSLWDIPSGSYTLSLSGRELEPWGAVSAPAAGALDVAIAGATQIAGVVRDGKGAPVAGANVEGRDSRTRRLYLARSDKQGHFMLNDVTPGTVLVRVRPAHAAPPAAQEIVVSGASAPAALTFTVGSGAVIQGTITRSDGSAVAGATVTAGGERTATDAAGNYLIDSLDAGTYLVAASAPGTGAVSRTVTLAANGSASADLRLDPEGRIAGTVTAGGQPLAGARVVLADPGAQQDPIVTGTAGTFSLGGLAAGEHAVIVSADDFASVTRTVGLDPGSQAELAVALTPTGTITGRAAPGATVYARGPAIPLATETANGAGEFTFSGLPAGRYAVALDSGLSVMRSEVDLAGTASVDLRTSSSTLSGSTGAGRVGVTLLRDGEPVDQTVSGADGAYAFRIVAAGSYSVRAAGADYGIATSSARTVGSSDIAGVDVAPGPATLTVRVRTAAGAPAAGATATLTPAASGGPALQADTGADGTARFTGLPAGSYRVSAATGGAAVPVRAAASVAGPVGAGGAAPVDAAGEAGGAAPIDAAGEANGATPIDAAGEASGATPIDAAGAEISPVQTVALPAGGATADVQTAAASSLAGTVRDAGGRPIAGVNVLVTDAAGVTTATLTAADGRYALARLRPGTVDVAFADGRHGATVRSVTAGGTLDVTLATVAAPVTVTTAGAVRGLLEVRRDARLVPVLYTGARDGLTGTVSLGGLEPSLEYRLTLTAPGRAAIRTTFTTNATGAPVALPATIALPVLAALPSASGTASSAKAKRTTAAAPELPGLLEDIKETIFHAFDVAGNQMRPPEHLAIDDESWRLEWVNYADNSCDPELAADLAAARDAATAIEKAFSDWQIDWEAARDLRSDDFVKLNVAATNMAAQVTLLFTSMAGLEAAVAAEATLTAGQAALLNALGNLSQTLSTVVEDLRTGQGLVGGWSSFVDHVLNAIGQTVSSLGADGGLAEGYAFLDIMKTAMHDIDALRNDVDDNVAKTMSEYLADQQKYLDAVKRYKAALDRLKHYSAPPGEKCPDPPPPTPPVLTADPLGEPNIEGIRSDDPNDIAGPAGYGSGHYLPEGSALEYLIRYENKATASLPARKVVITHVLDADADLRTFELGSAGFNAYTVTAPEKRQSWRTTIDDSDESGTLVEVDARLNAATRTATWTFTALDARTGDEPADPLVGFLPPAKRPPEGGGFATYRVKALGGTRTLDAQARIVFDANEAIDTNVYANSIDVTAPVSSVSPLPATTSAASFPVQWSGSDQGAGIARYDVFVSADGGAFTPWLAGTRETSATYAGAAGHRYAFYSVATDGVGLVQATPAGAQAQTEVIAPAGEQQPPPVIVQPAPTPTPVAPASPFKPRLTVVRKRKGTYELRIRNAGAKADAFKLRGTKKAGLTVRYLAGKKDVTKLVLKGSYRTATVAPGKTITLRLTVKGTKKAALTVTATSVGAPALRSVATARYPR